MGCVCVCWKDGDECTACIITQCVWEDHLSALWNDINLKLCTPNICLFVSCINNLSLQRKMFTLSLLCEDASFRMYRLPDAPDHLQARWQLLISDLLRSSDVGGL